MTGPRTLPQAKQRYSGLCPGRKPHIGQPLRPSGGSPRSRHSTPYQSTKAEKAEKLLTTGDFMSRLGNRREGSRPPLLLGQLCLLKSQGLFTMHGWKEPLQKQADKSAEIPGSVDQALPALRRNPGSCVCARQDLHSLNHILSPELHFN